MSTVDEEYFRQLDALIAEMSERTLSMRGRIRGRRNTVRFGFGALDRGDDTRMLERVRKGPHRENGPANRAAALKGWETRRAKAG